MLWQEELKRNVTRVKDLPAYISLEEEELVQLEEVVTRHPMSITRYYLSLMDSDDRQDPLRRMAVPSLEELDSSGSYDTSGELENVKVLGLQHKYSQTALVLATNQCPVYCRFCFRKRLVGLPSREVARRFDRVVEYVRSHPHITNVLVSGGDPLILSTPLLEGFLLDLARIDHLRYVRIGTRTPATFPTRILQDPSLVEAFRRFLDLGKRLYVVTHFNHPRELTPEARKAVNLLLEAGLVVNNQAVLLRGVNDSPHTLAQLMTGLVEAGVVPYYLFQCRPVKRVKGAFQVELEEGYWIVEEAKRYLDGLAKRFRYVMSHRTGKVEIVGIQGNYIYLKYHQAADPFNSGLFFRRRLKPGAGWLDDLADPVRGRSGRRSPATSPIPCSG